MLGTILVPLDGSTLSHRAVPYGKALALRAGARLVLLEAVPPSAAREHAPTAGEVMATQRAESELAKIAGELSGDGAQTTRRLVMGEPGLAIVDAVKEERADLIVMSTHGRSGLGRWLYGSVADEVLRRLTAPLLLIPAGCDHAWRTDRALRILVALDGSRLAEEVLGPVAKLAAALGAELLLVQVIEVPVSIYPEAAAYIPFDAAAELAAANAYLEGVAGKLRAVGLKVAVEACLGSMIGTAPTVIGQVADAGDVDLMAMATHGRGGLARLVLGSVATSTLQRATRPILLVRPASLRPADVDASAAPLTA